jgi:outer membrane protein insertion porin family
MMLISNRHSNLRYIIFSSLFICIFINHITVIAEEKKTPHSSNSLEVNEDDELTPSAARTINEISITYSGTKLTPPQAILNYIPYKKGEVFEPNKTSKLIRNVYDGLKRFRQIKVFCQNVGTDQVNLRIDVLEKPILKEVLIEGNKALTEAEIKKKINLDLPAIDQEELMAMRHQIAKLYIEKGYNNPIIDAQLFIDDNNKATAEIIIKEGKKSIIKRIMFEGNEHLTDKELRKVIFTREDWLLSLLDKSGTFHPDRLEGDKAMIEQAYQNNGYLQAKVSNVRIELDECDSNKMTLVFEIEEGALYCINEVHAPGNDVLSEEVLLANIPIQPGMLYSRERIMNSIKRLEAIWGNHGYIFAHVEPSIQPDEDTKTVSISFFSDLGNKMHLNRLTIKGNKKTRDKIIRRRLLLEEGDLITQAAMDLSKNNVESLGYFEPRDGVNWKLRKVDDESADLDLIVNEAKTGHFSAQLGFGGNVTSVASGLTVKGNFSNTNLWGSGITFNVDASWAKEEQTFLFHLSQPWLFDRPISGAIDMYHRRPSYDQFRNISIPAITQKLTGGSSSLGFITRSKTSFLNDTQILGSIGVDSIRYVQKPSAALLFAPTAQPSYQEILNKEFASGDYAWLSASLEQNTVNHPVHMSRGYRWRLYGKAGFPTLGSDIGYYRFLFDSHWFTPLINEYDLVFHLHAAIGFSNPFKNRSIPYSELFLIGGPGTVRGFLFGQVGPKFYGDPVGASKALYWGAELIFPITPDMNMKGVAFYDGGAGFHNPYTQLLTTPAAQAGLLDNRFDYRHAVGVGIRMLSPMPIKIDCGFKLDPRVNESPYEVHFGMAHDW